MAEDRIDVGLISEKTDLEHSHLHLRRHSIAVIIDSPKNGPKIFSRYLRPPVGSCHDLCKYGIKDACEVKPWKQRFRKTGTLPINEGRDLNKEKSSPDQRTPKEKGTKATASSTRSKTSSYSSSHSRQGGNNNELGKRSQEEKEGSSTAKTEEMDTSSIGEEGVQALVQPTVFFSSSAAPEEGMHVSSTRYSIPSMSPSLPAQSSLTSEIVGEIQEEEGSSSKTRKGGGSTKSLVQLPVTLIPKKNRTRTASSVDTEDSNKSLKGKCSTRNPRYATKSEREDARTKYHIDFIKLNRSLSLSSYERFSKNNISEKVREIHDEEGSSCKTRKDGGSTLTLVQPTVTLTPKKNRIRTTSSADTQDSNKSLKGKSITRNPRNAAKNGREQASTKDHIDSINFTRSLSLPSDEKCSKNNNSEKGKKNNTTTTPSPNSQKKSNIRQTRKGIYAATTSTIPRTLSASSFKKLRAVNAQSSMASSSASSLSSFEPLSESSPGKKSGPTDKHETKKEGDVSKSKNKYWPKRIGIMGPENRNVTSRKLKFRRGTVVEIQPENIAPPKRLKFKRVRSHGEIQNGNSHMRKRSSRNNEEPVLDEVDGGSVKSEKSGMKQVDVSEGCRRRSSNFRRREADSGGYKLVGIRLKPERVVLRHRDSKGREDRQSLYNNVIEETASKLVQTRKSKVKALVGAFETVISLQDTRPSATIGA